MSGYDGNVVRANFNETLNDWRSDEIAICFIKSMDEFSLFNNAIMKTQMTQWRKEAKQGKVKIMAYNNKTKIINGKEYYTLIVQPYKDEKLCLCEIDVMALFCGGEMVSGYMYMFNNVTNRDMVYNYVMKGVSQPTN